MKHLYFALCVIAFCFFTQCIKDPDSIKGPQNPIDTITTPPIDLPMVDNDFYVSADYMGKNWKANYFKIFDYRRLSPPMPGRFLIEFGIIKGNWVEYGLACDRLPIKTGRHKIGATDFSNLHSTVPASLFYVMDYDNLLGEYHIDTTRNNYFEITKLDTIKRIMEGSFEMYHSRKLYPDWPIPPHPLPDTANFTNGRFRIKWE